MYVVVSLQLNNVLIFVLAAAAIVEGALQSWAEFGLVLGVIAINTGGLPAAVLQRLGPV